MASRPRPGLVGVACRIGVYAPSGVVNPVALANGVRTLESFGHRLSVAPEVLQQWRYFAGTDAERLRSFHRMLADPEIDLMIMARGGYGWSRLMPHIDWQAVRESSKVLMGYSDFTAFQLGALRHANVVTFAGPGVASDFDWSADSEAIADDHAFMNTNCWPVLRGETHDSGWIECAHDYPAQTMAGTLWGSNLSLLSHLVGTPHLPEIDGGILFIEEIDEAPYRIERMFLQLLQAGVLSRQRALVLGAFSGCDPQPGRFPYSMEHVVESLRAWLPVPVLTGLPFGHVARKLTLPFGAEATLQVDAGRFSLQY
ncbi:MAG: LD-carboxypeptidase [Betaproteobacteria bacterium]|nr:LD-carboxypeptidase [Betaproteobacteria bacterium]